MANISLQDLIFEIAKSFEEISDKKILLNLDKRRQIPIKRSPEITYGIRNFIGNAVKFSNKKVEITLNIIDDKVSIEILDDGPGFPSDVFNLLENHIFLQNLSLYNLNLV